MSFVSGRSRTSKLCFSAVRQAVLSISGENKVIGAGAGVSHATEVLRRDEAEVRAPTIGYRARIVISQLLDRVVHVNVVGPMGCVAQRSEVCPFWKKLCISSCRSMSSSTHTCKFVRPQDCLEIPIGPIEPIIEYR